MEAHLQTVTPEGVTLQLIELHGDRPWKGSIEGPYFEAAAEALEEAFGKKPVPVGGGGSIPIVVEFEKRLEAPALLLGFSLPGCNLHAPNEWLSVENFEKGIGALVRLYGKLGVRH